MSSSQAKKDRRKARYERNVAKEIKHKKEAWNRGKLIEENHNEGPYSSDYTQELGQRLYDIIQDLKTQSAGNNEDFILKYRLYKNKIRDFILYYSPDIPKDKIYEYLKYSLEVYWDNPENLLGEL